MNNNRHDQYNAGFNNPDGLHTNAAAIHGAASRRAAEFKLDLPAPAAGHSSGGSATFGSTVKGLAVFVAIGGALYGWLGVGTLAASAMYAAVGSVSGAVAGAVLYVAMKVLAFALRMALYGVGIALVILAIRYLLAS